MTLLALKYRPRSFADLVGQVSVRLILQSFASSKDVPPAFLFSGPSGVGKTSTARIFAAALNCENSVNGDCCAVCDSCVSIQNSSSAVVHEVDAASSGGVDDIRALKSLAQFGVSSSWRVIILDEAHSMSKHAFNALLKILEEPMSNTVFILLTTEPNKILNTVRSRSMPIDFKSVSDQAIFLRLKDIKQKESFAIEDAALEEISHSVEGGLRDSLMLLDQSISTNSLTVDSVRQLTGRSNIPELLLVSIIDQDFLKAREYLEHYFQSNSSPAELISGLIESLQRRFITGSINYNNFIPATKLLWDARSLSLSSRDTRLQIESMITLLYAVFHREKKPVVVQSILPVEEPSKADVVDDTINNLEELMSLVEE